MTSSSSPLVTTITTISGGGGGSITSHNTVSTPSSSPLSINPATAQFIGSLVRNLIRSEIARANPPSQPMVTASNPPLPVISVPATAFSTSLGPVPAISNPAVHPAGISSGSQLLSFINSAPIFSTGSLPSPSDAADTSAFPNPPSFSPAGASPSLATLLATPLANLGPSKTPPLVLSSALPPIPGKVVEAIRMGAFVDFRDLLMDNVALRQRVVDSGLLGSSSSQSLRLREISDIVTWLHCFLAFVAAKVECKETRDLMAYGQIILMLARKHGGMGWRAYDTHFRQLVGAGHNLPWTELSPSMLAANVLQAVGQFCSLCQSHDHRKDDCALAPPPSLSERRPRPYRVNEEVCRRFNRSTGCSSTRCRFEHKCWTCGQFDHGAPNCRSKPEVSKPRSLPATSYPNPRKD